MLMITLNFFSVQDSFAQMIAPPPPPAGGSELFIDGEVFAARQVAAEDSGVYDCKANKWGQKTCDELFYCCQQSGGDSNSKFCKRYYGEQGNHNCIADTPIHYSAHLLLLLSLIFLFVRFYPNASELSAIK